MQSVLSRTSAANRCCVQQHTRHNTPYAWGLGPQIVERYRDRLRCSARAPNHFREDLLLRVAVVFGVTAAASMMTGLPTLAAELSRDHHHTAGAEAYELASNEDFWSNLTQYVRFFISVLAGTAYVAFKPIAGFLRKPSTAIPVLIGIAAFLFFIKATVTAMLGSADPLDPFAP